MSGGSVDERSQEAESADGGLPLSGLDPGTTILVSGPPLVGKYDLVLDALGRGMERGAGAIVVSTRDDEREVVADLDRVAAGFDESLLGVVECISEQRDEPYAGDGAVMVRRASSPADLTGVGIGASELMNDFSEAGVSDVRLAVDSLSTLLLYTEFDRMARFLHVLSGRIDRAGGMGLFVVNPGTIDAGQYDQLKTLFDGLVEFREREERRELRIRGLPGIDDDWRRYRPPGGE